MPQIPDTSTIRSTRLSSTLDYVAASPHINSGALGGKSHTTGGFVLDETNHSFVHVDRFIVGRL